MLAARAGAPRRADRAGADAARTCRSCAATPRKNLCETGAYELAGAERRQGPRLDLRVRLRGRDRHERAQGPGRAKACRRASSRCHRSSSSCSSRTTCRAKIIGDAPVRSAVEAAVRWGWDAVIGDDGIFVGMTRLRRLGADQGPLRPFRHHGRGGRRGGHEAPQRLSPRRPSACRHPHQPGKDKPCQFASPSTDSAGSAATSCAPSSRSKRKDIEVVAINDLGPVETNAHLLRYDSIHGKFPAEVDGGRRFDRRPGPAHPGHRDQGSGDAAAQGARHRHRDRMHRHLHRARQGGGPSRRRRQARHRLGPGRRRRPDGRLWRQPPSS